METHASTDNTITLEKQKPNEKRIWKETGPVLRIKQLNTRLETCDRSKLGQETDSEQEKPEDGLTNDTEDIFEEGLGVFGDSKVAHGRDGAAFFYKFPENCKFAEGTGNKKGLYITLSEDKNMTLFAHYVWNSALILGDYLAEDKVSCANERVLELGAGSGLPSLMAVLKGAESVVITDYPEPAVIANLRENAERNLPAVFRGKWAVEEHCWGESVETLLNAALQPGRVERRFDSVYVADCLWLHYQHRNLLATCQQTIGPQGRAHVIFCNHSGASEWMGFFDAAEADFGLVVEHVHTIKVEGAWGDQYELDDYSEEKRTIRYFTLRHRQ
eukprot:comp57276_c0_seq1/m.47803 comp57276_c0_seq1/g.47803  ORF comp57276_c0_seq1/g.47803 comp57276_c0_seq1/m.47803 type:complete len:330 (-) comp57276_c0_seq1:63-1052(-)